ncbi:hypothetical protein MXAN_6995 [Myxococcus xanthus DK 1622]|uniref:Uncharacterized protein n=1 Tax=Myxococcus xanthus (strain DK1622) TaxID=246197 RepID=Q1CWW5_MYXXD|nr:MULTISPECIES: hypothetical protein [Myxococcus]ABF89875.1 hypothetical protein MXAN_6995 [Myxococcus xanthus DK 1622]NOJ56197.1 hypothetical protein [Myxococcus xanthus]QPM79274.1 hypothetical protein I5Q59_34420 [Myxococcus xanthus]QVW68352.1 hypothetical protein JTM82_01950 [Myxococcus xanthus DZ2]QZZ54598.1 hypothetical protein MyxoNM_35735 [Myxococcus xanthus]
MRRAESPVPSIDWLYAVGDLNGDGPYVLYQVNRMTGAAMTPEQAFLGGASGPELRDIAIMY